MTGRPARRRPPAVVAWVLAAEVATAAGAGFGSAVVGRNSLLLIPWLVPGLVMVLIALERIERSRGGRSASGPARCWAVALFLPGLAIGSGIEEAIAR
jgi:hypothetical protein